MFSTDESLVEATYWALLLTGVGFALIVSAGWLVQRRPRYYLEVSQRRRYLTVLGGQLLLGGVVALWLSHGSIDDVIALHQFYWSLGFFWRIRVVIPFLVLSSPILSGLAAWHIHRDRNYQHLDGY